MEYEKIKQLITDVENSKLTAFEIDFPDGTKISMKKEHTIVVSENVKANTENLVNVAESQVKETLTKEEKVESGNIVTSPMVGTFYAKPSPTSEPYVEVGKMVAKGDTLCIIEAMKLMNEIESEYAGKVVEVLVKDGDVVEYGTPLFRIGE